MDKREREEANMARTLWQTKRDKALAHPEQLVMRAEMRYAAQWYAHYRGWNLPLTLPQRRKVSR